MAGGGPHGRHRASLRPTSQTWSTTQACNLSSRSLQSRQPTSGLHRSVMPAPKWAQVHEQDAALVLVCVPDRETGAMGRGSLARGSQST
jgi:hypothetical protein